MSTHEEGRLPASKGDRVAFLGVWLVAGLISARLVAQAFLDRRPRFTGAEASDLNNLMAHHYGARGYLGMDSLLIPTDGLKPPLYYGGLPLLLSWSESLSYAQVLLANLPAMLLLLWAAWRLGQTVGGNLAGFCCVASVGLLPASVGRTLLVGPDLWLVVAFGWSLVHLVGLTDEKARKWAVAGLGLASGLGMLVKWTAAFPLAGAGAFFLFWAWRQPSRSQLLRSFGWACAIGMALFLPWLLGMADLEQFLAAAGGEISDEAWLRMPPWLFPTVWTVTDGIGPWGLPLLCLAVSGAFLQRREVPETPGPATRAPLLGMLVCSVLVVYVIHSLLPHKEVRYLQSGIFCLGVLLGLGLWCFARRNRRSLVASLAGVLLLGTGSLVEPMFHERDTSDYFHQGHHYLDLDRHDWGLEELVLHPSIVENPAPQVGYFLRGSRFWEFRDLLGWELYSRNKKAVVSNFPDWRLWKPETFGDKLPEAVTEKLDRVTHLVNDLPLSSLQEEELTGFGFKLVFEARLPLHEAEYVQLWERSSPAP